MNCPKCKSNQNKKNGFRRGKQSYKCKNCGTQYVINPSFRSYSPQIKQTSIEMYLNGMGFRGIERVTGVHHTTIINWVKQVGKLLRDAYDPEVTPEVGELDELETFVGSKKTKYGYGQQ